MINEEKWKLFNFIVIGNDFHLKSAHQHRSLRLSCLMVTRHQRPSAALVVVCQLIDRHWPRHPFIIQAPADLQLSYRVNELDPGSGGFL